MAKKDKVPEEIQKLLKDISDHFFEEDREVRDRQIREWKRLKLLWDGFQQLWWSEVAHDWRVYDEQYGNDDNADALYYDKRINVYKAYLESIIAALSVGIPPVICYPDDAENDLDLSTARAGNKIAQLVYRHNDAPLLWLKALFILCTEGLVAAYNYTDYDEKYGTYETDEYEDVEEEVENPICNICQTNLIEEPVLDEVENQFDSSEEDVLANDLLNKKKDFCPQCYATIINPEIQKEKIIVTRLIGKNSNPKSRQCIEVYGGLFVKVANYAKCQADTPYLIFSYETSVVNAIESYPFLRSKMNENGNLQGPDGNNIYERWGRLSNQYRGQEPLETPTCRNIWLRPSAFNYCKNEDDVEKLKELYPFGVKVVYVNENFCEACPENLDDHWTLTHNPLSDYLHHDPLGRVLVPIQEVTNDLVSLVLQTIEHGISQVFVDPGVVDFKEYAEKEVSPGSIIPAIPKSGKSLNDSFFQVKTAQLSGEILPFGQKIQEFGQLVSGALPSLFGGENVGGSKTASEYSMSRAQALQRLQNTWKMLSIWWKNIFGKVIPAYIENVVEDEKYVERNKDGGFINTFIRRAEISGKIGSVELEAAENMPITWLQQKDIIMQLMQLNNPEILEAISAPENIDILKQVIGLPDFQVPGNDDRIKQYAEIQQLVNSEPIVIPGMPIDDGMGNVMEGQEQELPSVEVEQFIDNHLIQSEICRRWLVSDAGRIAKVSNPLGYRNVMLHMMGHVQFIQAAQMAAQSQQDTQNPDNKQSENKER